MENPQEKIASLNLQRATLEDVDAFLALENSVDGSHIYSAMTNKEEAIEEINKNTVYLIKKGDEIVGNVSYELKAPKHAYISGLVVGSNFQGQGIGREALELVLHELNDMEQIELVTHPQNTRAISLYESLGFKIESQYEDYYGDGEPRVKMVLIKDKDN